MRAPADERTPLRRDARDDGASAPGWGRTARALGVAACGTLALAGAVTTKRGGASWLGQSANDASLSDGAYVLRGGWAIDRYGKPNENFCMYNAGAANGVWGLNCNQKCVAGSTVANNSPEVVYVATEGNYRTLTRKDASGNEFRCVTAPSGTRAPNYRNKFILCEQPKVDGASVGDDALFTIAPVIDQRDGTTVTGKMSIKSKQWDKYCFDNGGKQECAFNKIQAAPNPRRYPPNTKAMYEFVAVSDPSNVLGSCP